MSLVLNIFPYYVSGDFITYTPNKISIAPKFPRPKFLPQIRKLPKYLTRRHTFHYLYHLCRGIPRWCLNKYMHMVFYHLHRIYPELISLSNPLKNLFQVLRNFPTQYVLPVLRYPYQVVLQVIYGMFCPSYTHAVFITVMALLWQTPLPRLTASHFHPASKLTGIQWSFL